MILVRAPGQGAIAVVAALRIGVVLVGYFRHLSPPIVFVRGGVAAWIDHIEQPIGVRPALVVVVLSRMVPRVGVAANNSIARGRRVIARLPTAIIVAEMFPAAAGKPVVYDLTEAVVTEIFPAAIRIGGRLDAAVPIAAVISPIIVLIFAPADVVRMARVREGEFDGRILTGESGRVGDFVHRAQHWFMLGRGRVPARIGKGVAVEIGSLVLEIGVVVYDSWATGILEPTGLPIPASYEDVG